MSAPNSTVQAQEEDKGKKNGGEPGHSKGMVSAYRCEKSPSTNSEKHHRAMSVPRRGEDFRCLLGPWYTFYLGHHSPSDDPVVTFDTRRPWYCQAMTANVALCSFTTYHIRAVYGLGSLSADANNWTHSVSCCEFLFFHTSKMWHVLPKSTSHLILSVYSITTGRGCAY